MSLPLKINDDALRRLAAQEAGRPVAQADTDGSALTFVGGEPIGGETVASPPPQAVASMAPVAVEQAALTGSAAGEHLRGGSNMATYSALVHKRPLSARRDCYTSCCMVFFPVVLVWFSLSLLRISSRITSTPKPLLLLPADVLKNACSTARAQSIHNSAFAWDLGLRTTALPRLVRCVQGPSTMMCMMHTVHAKSCTCGDCIGPVPTLQRRKLLLPPCRHADAIPYDVSRANAGSST